MDDSTLSETTKYYWRRDDVLSRYPLSVSACDLFGDALLEYMNTSTLIDELDTAGSDLTAAAGVVHMRAKNLVIAAADYHTARRVFEAQKALLELDRPEPEEEA
jgi:hypothetical protein